MQHTAAIPDCEASDNDTLCGTSEENCEEGSVTLLIGIIVEITGRFDYVVHIGTEVMGHEQQRAQHTALRDPSVHENGLRGLCPTCTVCSVLLRKSSNQLFTHFGHGLG